MTRIRRFSSLALLLPFASVLLAQAPAWPRDAEAPAAPRPAPPPPAMAPLIGEYKGPSGAHLYVLERDGRLWTILDRGEATPFNEGRDLIVTRGAGGRVSSLGLPTGTYTRLQVGPESGGQLHITPVRPVEPPC